MLLLLNFYIYLIIKSVDKECKKKETSLLFIYLFSLAIQISFLQEHKWCWRSG